MLYCVHFPTYCVHLNLHGEAHAAKASVYRSPVSADADGQLLSFDSRSWVLWLLLPRAIRPLTRVDGVCSTPG